MRTQRIPLPEPIYRMRYTIPAQRMYVPAVVLLQAREIPFELEWSLSPAQARALAARLLDAAVNCNRLDSLACTAGCD